MVHNLCIGACKWKHSSNITATYVAKIVFCIYVILLIKVMETQSWGAVIPPGFPTYQVVNAFTWFPLAVSCLAGRKSRLHWIRPGPGSNSLD